MRPLFPSPTRISHLALCDQANARIAGCVRRNPDEATQEGKTFVSAMTGSTNPHSREVDQLHPETVMGALPPNPRSFPHWANGQTPQKDVPRRRHNRRHDTEAKAPLASSAAPVALRQSRILRTIRNHNPQQAASPILQSTINPQIQPD
jgi:hypothetical protein